MMVYLSDGYYLVDDDGAYDGYRGGDSAAGVIAFAAVIAIISDLFACFALPVISYFMFIQNAPNAFIGILESLPMLVTSLIVWLVNICLFSQFVLKKSLFKRMSISLPLINRIIRIMLILTLIIALICNLVSSAPHIESEAYFGAIFAYNFLIAILETIALIKADAVGKKSLFSLLISFVLGGILGAIAIEIDGLREVAFEVTLLAMLIVLEISLMVFKKLHDR